MFNINYKELNSLGKEIDSLFNEALAYNMNRKVNPISNKFYTDMVKGVTFSTVGDWSARLYNVDSFTIKVAIRLNGESKDSIKAVLSDSGKMSRLHITGTIDKNLSWIKSVDRVRSNSSNELDNSVSIFYNVEDYSLGDINYFSGYLVCTLTRVENESKVNTKEIPIL